MAVKFDLSFEGQEADDHLLDFYDAAQAMVGFQRSLAITTHLVVNGSVITQAPALKNAKIYSEPPKSGSWEATAIILTGLAGGAFALGTAPKDTPLGHLISSAYDYVVSQTLGFHVNYEESLGQTLEHFKRQNPQTPQAALRETQFDSIIEKCEVPIRDMHRPIVFSETAGRALITSNVSGSVVQVGPALDEETFAYVSTTNRGERPQPYEGWVSSYNINTFKGRIYVPDFGRPIPFTLAEEMRTARKVALITTSLNSNARDRLHEDGRRYFEAFRNESSSGRLKGFHITEMASRQL